MSEAFNPNSFLSRDVAGQSFDPESFTQDMTLESTGDVRPEYADGLSPERAINKSPVDIVDRVKLAFGNERGKIQYLKSKFEDVQPSTDGLKIKKEGLWYNVDPSGLGEGNAWDRTKELIKDMADLPDVATSVASVEGGQIGATAAGAKMGAAVGTAIAPGAGTLVGGATGAVAGFVGGTVAGSKLGSYLNTSMGKLVGTYDATPDEQAHEAQVEMLFNLGGAAVPLGVQLTGRAVAPVISKASKGLRALSDGSKQLVAELLGAASGVKAHRIWRLASDEGDDIAKRIAQYVGRAPSREAAVAKMTDDSIDATVKLAAATRTGLSNFYRTEMDEVAKVAPAGFINPTGKAIDDVYAYLSQEGFGSQSGGLFKMNSLEDVIKIQQNKGFISDGSTKENYQALASFVKDLNTHKGAKNLSGSAGVRQLVHVNQKLGNLLYTAKTSAYDRGANGFAKMFDEVDTVFRDGAETYAKNQLADLGASSALSRYNSLRSTYAQYSDELRFLTDVNSAVTKQGVKAGERALTQILSNTGNRTAKSALESAQEHLARYSPEISDHVRTIYNNDAAAAFTPLIRGQMMQFGVGIGTAAALASGNMGYVAGTAATAAATSPSIARYAVRGGAKASQLQAQAALMGKNFVQKMEPKMRQSLANNPEALNAFFLGIANVANTADQTAQQLSAPLFEEEQQ